MLRLTKHSSQGASGATRFGEVGQKGAMPSAGAAIAKTPSKYI
ncbi:hypothetical protein [Nostoc sp. 'Peltigera malacea cyanobiont' DB3992]|nr:hypothetical protein [Nostoc sp. 'Peltigera malacea cyanobiont' DB3992]